jgi:hypothetical protein
MHFKLPAETVRAMDTAPLSRTCSQPPQIIFTRWSTALSSRKAARVASPSSPLNARAIAMNELSSCGAKSKVALRQSGGNGGLLSRQATLASVSTSAARDNGRLQQCQGDFGSWFRTLIVTAAIAGLQTACGGLPQTPNIREEISNGIQGLGVRPYYPLQETARVGELRLVDVKRASLTDVPSYLPTNILLSVTW